MLPLLLKARESLSAQLTAVHVPSRIGIFDLNVWYVGFEIIGRLTDTILVFTIEYKLYTRCGTSYYLEDYGVYSV